MHSALEFVGPLPAALAALDRDGLLVESIRVQSAIDEAFWRFTRCKGSQPPPMAVPHAYVRRAWVQEALRRTR